MNRAMAWTLGILGLALLAVTPYLWWVNAALLWIACPLLTVWALWLVISYLRWARGLGRK